MGRHILHAKHIKAALAERLFGLASHPPEVVFPALASLSHGPTRPIEEIWAELVVALSHNDEEEIVRPVMVVPGDWQWLQAPSGERFVLHRSVRNIARVLANRLLS